MLVRYVVTLVLGLSVLLLAGNASQPNYQLSTVMQQPTLYVEYNRWLTSLDSVLEQWESSNAYTLQPCHRVSRSATRAGWVCDAHKKGGRRA